MEAEAAIEEGEAVDFPEVDVDRKHEATLRDVVTGEVLVPAVGAPQTRWRVDCFPAGPGQDASCEYSAVEFEASTCQSELWMIIGKAAQREMRAKVAC